MGDIVLVLTPFYRTFQDITILFLFEMHQFI